MVDKQRRFFLRSKQKISHQSLPWVKDADAFSDHCTRCGKCQQACPERIIVSGDGGFPTIDFNKGECTFCYACAESCPERLFQEESTVPWNQTVSITSHCLAKNAVECRSCADVCEPRAIQFQMTRGSVAQPLISTSSCTGCGACVSPCPVSAISMEQSL
ncbi:ferredoxin-type protein NapF [Enterovibrio sp. ZSDZ35]|uniref:Ferredoxin-type protein NapF n=1 Tax=Enterovibrio qingdaonensis TaxID=2899818 RepID=A0ABT5QIQ1_9GAMM|nr:ferredoxin-type protein NapF [Enterovibrio sp. ZSDZ35]MDD1780866.1 ferredoxin-type protein NapF [Enterovibrio sp. ZSDZ35]